ncbi:MAG TPA: hypothetical protein PKM88_02075 [bacterium]|nr:hypothetical protein [bacterium]
MNGVMMGGLAGGLGLLLLGQYYLTAGTEGAAGMFRRAGWPRLARQRGGVLLAGMLFGLLQQSAPAAIAAQLGYLVSGVLAPGLALAGLTAAPAGAALVCMLFIVPLGDQAWLLAGLAVMLFMALRSSRFRHLARILLGVALALAAAALLTESWSGVAADGLAAFSANNPGGLGRCLLAGVFGALLFRSTLVVFVLTATFWSAGGIGFAGATMVLLGELAGSALAGWLALPADMPAVRRLALAQLAVVMLTVLPLVLLLAPGVAALAELNRQWYAPLTLTPAALAPLGMANLALVLLLPRLLAAAAGLVLSPLAGLGLAKTEVLQPVRLTGAVMAAPESAMDFIAHELARQAGRLPEYLEQARQALAGTGTGEAALTALERELQGQTARIEEGLSGMTNRDLSPESARRLINLAHRQQALVSVAGQVRQFAGIAARREFSAAVADTMENFLEALDALLLTMVEATQRPQVGEIGMLLSATENRGATLEKLRSVYLTGERTMELADRTALLGTINHFEICAWSLHRYGELLFAAETD